MKEDGNKMKEDLRRRAKWDSSRNSKILHFHKSTESSFEKQLNFYKRE